MKTSLRVRLYMLEIEPAIEVSKKWTVIWV
jgi:hypothetical protein